MSTKAEDIYQEITGKSFPTEADERLMSKALVGQMLLGKEIENFRLRGAAILYDNFEEVEKGTAMKYTGFDPTGMSQNKPAEDGIKGVLDLLAMGFVRSDLHAPGVQARTITYGFKEKNN